MRLALVLAMFGVVGACSTAVISNEDTARGEDVRGLVGKPLLTCGNDACWTPTMQASVGSHGKWRFVGDFAVPPKWKLVGPPSAVFVGSEVHDVETTAWDANGLTCNWHTEGSGRLGGPGGSVSGYCIVPAQYKWLDCQPGKPC